MSLETESYSFREVGMLEKHTEGT